MEADANYIDDPLEILEEEAKAVAKKFGVAACDDAAAMLVERVLLRLGGANIYVSKKRSRDRARIRDEVKARFNGANSAQLAAELGVTPRWIRKLANG